MNQKTSANPEVRVKFSIDASSREASEKLQTEKFVASVRKDSATITKNASRNK